MKYILLDWFNLSYKDYKLIDEQNDELSTEELLKDIEENYFNDKESDSYKIYGEDIISYFKENLLNDKNSSINLIDKERYKQ